jgi:hypothetical protein
VCKIHTYRNFGTRSRRLIVRRIIIGVIGALLMVGSIGGYLYFMRSTEVKVSTMLTLKPVRLLSSGEIIDASMVHSVTSSVAAHSAEAVEDIHMLIGKVVSVPISKDEEFASWKLSSIRLTPKEGERYFSFKTDNATNVNNMLRRGDRIDVWVEFDQPKLITESTGETLSVGAIKIIEGLMVSDIKTAEGLTVTDSSGVETFIQSDQTQFNNSRNKATGKPDLNTYIMSDEIYEAYVLGSIGGHIKLALPDLSNQKNDPMKVTDVYKQLRGTLAFFKATDKVNVTDILNKNDVKGAVVSPAPSSTPSSVTQDLSTPKPTAAEVKK